MNIYFLIIILILLFNYLLSFLVGILNIKYAKKKLPEEFKGYYDQEKYKKSQQYLKNNTYFKLIHRSVVLILVLILISSGGFNFIDQIARLFGFNQIVTGLIFAAILFILFQIIEIPFSAYHTFKLEEKYGFNRMRPKTFIFDLLKGWLLAFLIGGTIFAVVIWFFIETGVWAWVWCWIAISLFELFILFIAPVVIMPLFNKFEPLEEGELKETLQNYAQSQNFKIQGVFKMDGSKRSTKSNAYFTGFGRYRRIVLFDTLIEKHTVDELVSVLAHEMGHYKKNHIFKSILLSIITSGIMFFILSLFINNPGLFAAFKMENLSIYASLIFFSFLYAPISLILSIFGNHLSRKHEYEADFYAISTFKKPQAFIDALKKLSVDNLSNLTPHPLKVFLHYSHPPVLKRVEAIKAKIPKIP